MPTGLADGLRLSGKTFRLATIRPIAPNFQFGADYGPKA